MLGRDVAVKVLPRSLATDPERVARLLREARVVASLNHPNIAQIYGVEQGALVMELVHGKTLESPMPVGTALDYAGQIAAALEAAHEKGVVHRDLKPTNIMTTPDGTVKVLDFGLAAIEHESLTDLPGTQQEAPEPATVTRGGAIMGTPAYMSPEQASGKPVDKRTDIWSFGVVVWELLTGRRLFEGDTTAETLSNVKTAAIDLQRLPRETPIAIRDLLARCLDRDPRTRLRDIGEARIQIQRVSSRDAASQQRFSTERLASRGDMGEHRAGGRCLRRLFVIERRAARRLEPPLPLTFHIPAPLQTTFASGPALSPDGRHVAFTARSADGRVRIWVHSFDSARRASAAGHGGRVQSAVLVSRQPLRRVRDRDDLEEDCRGRRASRDAVRSVRPGIDRQPRFSRRRVELRRRHRLCHLEQRLVAHSGHGRRSGSSDSRRRLRVSGLSSRWRARSVYLVRK